MQKNKSIFHFFWQRLRALGWIDLVGVGIFLAILSIAFFFFLRKSDYAYITLRVSQTDTLNTYNDMPATWYIEKIQPGLKETDGLGQESVVIQRVHRVKSNNLNQDFYVDMKVKSVFNSRTKQYSYNGSTLLVGSFQTFKLQSLLLNGVVVNVQGNDNPPETKTFVLKGFLNPVNNDDQFGLANSISDGVQSYIVDSLEKGLTVTDGDGQTVAEIISIDKRPAKRQFVYQNAFISVPDPDREHVEMTVKVKASKINDAYFYKSESPMLVNSVLYFSFPKSNVNFTVTSLSTETSK